VKYINHFTGEGVLILVILIAIWLTIVHQNAAVPQVAGEAIVTDANHPVEIYYGQPQYLDLNSIADDLNVKIYPEDKVQTFPDPSFGIGSKIVITRATAIYVTDAKKLTIYRTWQKTIRELLKEKNIELLGQDSSDPSLDTWLRNNMSLTITRVAEVEVTETEPIEFQIIKKNTVDLEKGQTAIQTKGVKGEKEVTYTIKRVDGEEVSRTVKDTKVIKEPVFQVLLIGIGPKLVHNVKYQDWLNQAAKQYLINATALYSLMLCESGGNPESGIPNSERQGLFQFDPSFWPEASSEAGFARADISNAEAQIFTTAYYISIGQSYRWPPWSKGCPRTNYQPCKNQ